MSLPGNFKRHKKKIDRASLDGFISPDSFKRRSGSLGFGNKIKNSDEKADRLDDFNRPDGYHPTVSNVAGSEQQTPLLPNGPRMRRSKSDLSSNLDISKKSDKKRRFKLFKRPESWPKFLKKSALVLGALLLITGGYLAFKLYTTQKHVFAGGGHAAAVCDGNIPIDQLNKEGDSRVNILLIGIGGPGHDGPDLTDTLIIASVDTINNKVDLLSIPRDLWVQTPYGGASKINAIYPNAKQSSVSKSQKGKVKDGLIVLDKTISQIMGVPIHYNVLVDFKAFKDSVNAVGGVKVNVPETLYDPTIAWENNYNPTIATKGIQTFNGNKALLYAKSRETSSDFARGERQRLLLVALKEKVLSLGTFSNPIKVSNLLNSFGSNVYTDFDLTSVKCLYKQVSEIPSSSIKSLDLVTPPHALLTTGPIGNQSTVFPRAGLFNYDAIRTYVRTTLRDSELAKENAKIMVLNGTNITGVASTQAAILKSFGYNIGSLGDAPTHSYQKTVIVDLKNGINKYTQNYLEKRFGVKVIKKLPDSSINPGTSDFVIIIGADATNSN